MRSLALAGSESLLPTSATVGAGDLLIEALAEAVARKLERMVASQQRLLDVEDAAKYLGMTAHALRHKAGNEVPVVKIDNKLRFDRRDLDRYIDRAQREGV
jgi:Helix-turn-helix domain